jgi:hypothetical protein
MMWVDGLLDFCCWRQFAVAIGINWQVLLLLLFSADVFKACILSVVYLTRSKELRSFLALRSGSG